MRNKLADIFRFPRNDLEGRWWHRLCKVTVVASVGAMVLLSGHWSNEIFQPYYTYSFDKHFASQPGKTRNLQDLDLLDDDQRFLIASYKYSDAPDAYEYIDALEEKHSLSFVVINVMKNDERLDGVLVKDLEYNLRNYLGNEP